jgi:hypothetical protein
VGGQVKLARQEYQGSAGGAVNQDLVVKLEPVGLAVSADIAVAVHRVSVGLVDGVVKLVHPVLVGSAVKVGSADTVVK